MSDGENLHPGPEEAREAAGDAPATPPPVTLGRADPKRAVHVLLKELTRRPALATAAALTLIAEAAISLVPPVAIGLIVDVLAGVSPRSDLTLAIVLLAAAAAGTAVAAFAAAALTARLTEPAVGRLREDALAAAVDADAAHIERVGSGDLTERLTADIERISEAASGTLSTFVGAALSIVLTLFGLAFIGWQFALAGLLAVPVQVGALRWYLRRSGPVFRRAREAESIRTQRLLDAVRAAPAIRALREEERRLERMGEASRASVELEVDAIRIASRFYGRLNLAEFIDLAAILLVGYLTVKSGAATIGAATTAALFFARLFGPMNTLLGLFGTVQEAGASLVRVVAVADLEPNAARNGGEAEARGTPSLTNGVEVRSGVPRASRDASVKVRGLSVVYENGREALRGVSLDIAPGERVALVGESGSGKSTLARVIAGFVVPSEGMAEIAGAAGDVVLLEQATHVFSGSLRDDLWLAAPGADDGRLREALIEAGVDLGHGAFADGLDSELEDATVTAADAQHIALTRLALADPPVAILDEAGAEGGSIAAARLEAAVDRISAGRTTLVIAHRLSQAASADRIVVLAGGEVVAAGTHAELAATPGPYAELWSAWAGSDRAGSPTS
ncbi:MAG TPA: ABC transporter ATP-binding protein [Solirubrobacterales bacterium]